METSFKRVDFDYKFLALCSYLTTSLSRRTMFPLPFASCTLESITYLRIVPGLNLACVRFCTEERHMNFLK